MRHCELRSSRSCAESQLLRLRSASHLCPVHDARAFEPTIRGVNITPSLVQLRVRSAGGRGKRCHALNRRPPRRRDATPGARRRPFIGPITAESERRVVQFRAMTHAPVRMNTRVSSYMPATVPNITKCTPAQQRTNSTATLCYMSPARPATDYVGVGITGSVPM